MQQKRRIAFVDDEPWVLIGIRDIIDWADYGFECAYTFQSAEEALETLSQDPVDAIVSDIRLVEMSGLELVCQLKERSLVRVAAIVSAYRDFNYAKQAILQGVVYYLLKPLDRAEVRDMAERMSQQLDEMDALREAQDSKPDDASPDLSPRPGNWYLLLEGNALTDVKIVSEHPMPKHHAVLVNTEQQVPLSSLRPGFSRRRELPTDIQAMLHEADLSRRLDFRFCTDEFAENIQLYIARHFSNPELRIANIAEEFYISEVYLSEYFKKRTGMTIGNFLIHVRLKEAEWQLINTILPVSAIAENVGYLDAGYFARIFRKKKGESPERFRRLHKAGGQEHNG